MNARQRVDYRSDIRRRKQYGDPVSGQSIREPVQREHDIHPVADIASLATLHQDHIAATVHRGAQPAEPLRIESTGRRKDPQMLAAKAKMTRLHDIALCI